jgi:hypothetical protein
MPEQIMVGALASVLGICIHAAMTLAVIRFARTLGRPWCAIAAADCRHDPDGDVPDGHPHV